MKEKKKIFSENSTEYGVIMTSVNWGLRTLILILVNVTRTGEEGGIILQIKLVQWSLIKTNFPPDGSPTLTSIYVPATTSQPVFIVRRYFASKKEFGSNDQP